MKFLRRFTAQLRSLFQSDDIPLRVLLADGRVLYDKHPLVRHGVIISRKHDIVLPYIRPISAYEWVDPEAPPVCVRQEYVYTAYEGLDPIAKIEAMYGFFQDGGFGIDHRKLTGPAWRRRISLNSLFLLRIAFVLTAALFVYVHARNDFEGFRQLAVWATVLATWAAGWATGAYSSLPEEPHWIIVAGTGAFLSLLIAGLAWLGLAYVDSAAESHDGGSRRQVDGPRACNCCCGSPCPGCP